MMTPHLRSIDPQRDIDRLYRYMSDERNQTLFSHSFRINSPQEFSQWLSGKLAGGDYHDFFMIDDAHGRTIGFTFSYEFFPYDRHCKFTLCLYEEFQGMGAGALAAALMMDYLFGAYPLRRIFVSIFDYNTASLEANEKGGFVEVGVLPEWRYARGEYHALHVLSISRQEFYARHQGILDKMESRTAS